MNPLGAKGMQSNSNIADSEMIFNCILFRYFIFKDCGRLIIMLTINTCWIRLLFITQWVVESKLMGLL